MWRGFTILFFSFLSLALGAQNPLIPGIEGDNLVPNPGFELFDNPPIGWYMNGKDYTNVVRYWDSPTGASPDAYSEKVVVPQFWAEKGFGRIAPRTGTHMSGITSYGCGGKPHCREYLQIQLREALVLGQKYYAEFWVYPLDSAIRNNNLGLALAEAPTEFIDDRLLRMRPTINADQILVAKNGKWSKIQGEFIAKAESDFLVLGNFYPDSLTSILLNEVTLPYGYYYIDDVLIKKLPPFLPIPIPKDDITKQKLEIGSTFALKNVFFEFDRAELLPRSLMELQKLKGILNKYPLLEIQINGHTDAIGSDAYNQTLSEERAASVVAFLVAAGINANRLQHKGYGRSQPTADNLTETGRQLNRRVEITVTKR